MKKIAWFHGPDAGKRLEELARKFYGKDFDFTEMPIDHYLPGSPVELRRKAITRDCIFLERFFHHSQFVSIYPLLIDLLEGEVTIAISSAELPHPDIADRCMLISCMGEIQPELFDSRTCRVCGCTDSDCRQCIKKTGHPCYWIEPDLCSACVPINQLQSS